MASGRNSTKRLAFISNSSFMSLSIVCIIIYPINNSITPKIGKKFRGITKESRNKWFHQLFFVHIVGIIEYSLTFAPRKHGSSSVGRALVSQNQVSGVQASPSVQKEIISISTIPQSVPQTQYSISDLFYRCPILFAEQLRSMFIPFAITYLSGNVITSITDICKAFAICNSVLYFNSRSPDMIKLNQPASYQSA